MVAATLTFNNLYAYTVDPKTSTYEAGDVYLSIHILHTLNGE